MGLTLFALGGSMVIAPVIIARFQGARTDDDFIRWLAGLPLSHILGYRCMSIAGFLVAGAGALINSQ